MTTSLLGRGIYDSHELARIVQRTTSQLDTWSRPAHGFGALLRPQNGRIYSFHDLITAAGARRLREDYDVAQVVIRQARDYLARELATDYPFAHENVLLRLATGGRALYWDSSGHGDWVDAGRGGQVPFQELVIPLLRAVDFGADHLASRWAPADGVLLDPAIQAGAPCVPGTRVPTLMLADLYDDGRGDDVDDLADDYDLPVALVQAAIDWERELLLPAA